MKSLSLHINDLPEDVILKGDLAIDTEAMGLKLTRDRLCMVQICDENENVHLIHFPEGSYDYSKAINLKKYLMDESRQKIFHFGRFDIKIMRYYLELSIIPNVYCTKIASRLTRTYTDNHGLRTLVGEICKIDLNKESQKTNWGSDKLSDAQKNYAANDVIYLHKIRDKLNIMLKNNNRFEIALKYFDFLNSVVESDMIGFEEDLFRHEY